MSSVRRTRGSRSRVSRSTSLAKAAAWSLAIGGSDDAERVALASTAGDDATGALLYSPGTSQLVVLAQGLEQPPAGMEYRCWMESGGRRTRIGKMFFAGDVAYWVGEVPDIDALGQDATFGVSPAPISDPDDVSADPILGGARMTPAAADPVGRGHHRDRAGDGAATHDHGPSPDPGARRRLGA